MPESSTPKATQVNLRCTYEEETCLTSAAEALGVNQSQLVELGLIQAVVDIGMTLVDDAAPRLKPGYIWPWEPKRPEGESAKARVTAYVPAIVYPTIESAAWALRLSVPQFAIGATLRLVALAKLINERRHKTEPQKHNPRLVKVVVPYGFDELAKTTRH
jgi:uncharacterized protein (DUF1778 family)